MINFEGFCIFLIWFATFIFCCHFYIKYDVVKNRLDNMTHQKEDLDKLYGKYYGLYNDYKDKYEKVCKEYVYTVETTLECMVILNKNPNARLVSKDEQLQKRIDLYYEMRDKNVAIFLTPTLKEYEEMFCKVDKDVNET